MFRLFFFSYVFLTTLSGIVGAVPQETQTNNTEAKTFRVYWGTLSVSPGFLRYIWYDKHGNPVEKD